MRRHCPRILSRDLLETSFSVWLWVALNAVVVCATVRRRERRAVVKNPLRWCQRYPGLTSACPSKMLTYQINAVVLPPLLSRRRSSSSRCYAVSIALFTSFNLSLRRAPNLTFHSSCPTDPTAQLDLFALACFARGRRLRFAGGGLTLAVGRRGAIVSLSPPRRRNNSRMMQFHVEASHKKMLAKTFFSPFLDFPPGPSPRRLSPLLGSSRVPARSHALNTEHNFSHSVKSSD